MAITYYMLQLPAYLFFILMVGLFALVAGGATLIFRRYVRIEVQRAHNEVTGFLFLAIASFYGLLLSFVVLVVWDKLNETVAIVSEEGSTAVALYRDIEFYPDTTATHYLKAAYLTFAFNVIDDEFPRMARMERGRKTSVSLDQVFVEMGRLQPKTDMELMLVTEMVSQLNYLVVCRGQRLTTMENEISPPMWLPLILGAFITTLMTLLLDIEHRNIHILLDALMGAFIGIFFFTIILLDHPYAGSRGIQPDRYMQIFTSEDWTKDQVPAPAAVHLP